MWIHSRNFGSKTLIRCGSRRGVYNYEEHIHQFPEIVFCREGELFVTIDGKEERMQKGDIAIISPFRAHSFRTPEYTDRWICVFSADFALGVVASEDFYAVPERAVFHAEPELIAYVERYITDSGEEPMELTAELIRSYKIIIGAIYDEYLRKCGTLYPKRHGKTFSAVLLYIAQHYKEALSLSSIGAALGYNPKYISDSISAIEGFNLPDLINSFRADHAKMLLASTDMKVIDIGYECGYQSEKSFHRAFRAITGITPGEYRRSVRGRR